MPVLDAHNAFTSMVMVAIKPLLREGPRVTVWPIAFLQLIKKNSTEPVRLKQFDPPSRGEYLAVNMPFEIVNVSEVGVPNCMNISLLVVQGVVLTLNTVL